MIGCRFVTRGKNNYEASPALVAPVGGTLYANRSMMPINNSGDDRQPQAHPRFFGRHKRIEDLLPQFSRNSRPRIFNRTSTPSRFALFALAAVTRNVPPPLPMAS